MGFPFLQKWMGVIHGLDESAPWIGWECSIKVDGFYEKAIHNFHNKPSLDLTQKHLKEVLAASNSQCDNLQEYI